MRTDNRDAANARKLGEVRNWGVVWLLAMALALSACNQIATREGGGEGMAMDDGMAMDMSGGSMAADTLGTQDTENGLFRVSAVSQLDPVVINETHAWTLHLETADGSPVTDAEIAVDGGMPEHDHGFPTAPRVTENLGEGEYLLEGMRFNMGGVWVLTLAISSGGQSDTVTFEFELK